MPLTKKYVKSKQCVRVTFKIPHEFNPADKEIRLLGEFNEWDWSKAPRLSKKKCCYEAKVDLKPGREYQYRYLIDGVIWTNDRVADAYRPNQFTADYNCIVDLTSITMPASVTSSRKRGDDLKRIQGIGHQIAEILHQAGIASYLELATMKKKDLKSILAAAGRRFQIHDPSSWPKQAKLLSEGKMKALEEYQAKLKAKA
ncbi:MAG: hypothetical protein AAFQ02_06465 [Bacteroidota bacterium]